MRRLIHSSILICAALAGAAPVLAQSIVTSPGPDAGPGNVNVSIYRDPARGSGGGINLGYLQGFALISETRTISLPAGASTIRFEGVADGIIAVSAVVTGLPGGVAQKNRDAAILSPAALVDGTLGNRVTIRRTNPATGKVSEESAVIRTGPQGRVIFQTADGYEALRCSGLPEGLRFDAIPSGLSATPTLSVDTTSTQAVTAKVTLTYLATGFDWAANYVATINPDGNSLNLFAWLTLANSNDASFKDAQLLAIAGTLNKQSNYDELVGDAPSPALNLSCYPLGSGKAGLPQIVQRYEPGADMAMRSMVMAPPPAPAAMMESASPIVVTASRVARQEDLGDLKLYRVPMRVTIAANGQKQVALLQKPGVQFRRVYESGATAGQASEGSMPLILRMKNEDKDGLGIPLPSGGLAVYEANGARVLLAGNDTLRDHAVKEEVEVGVQRSTAVRYSQRFLDGNSMIAREAMKPGGAGGRWEVRISNAKRTPVDVEWAVYTNPNIEISQLSAKLRRKDGQDVWFVRVPANGEAVLTYRAKISRRR